MKINIPNIDTSRFYTNNRHIPGIGDVVVIVPHKVMHEWGPDEYHLRSVMTRPDGTILSSGFPKFFNYTERPTLDKEFDTYHAAGNVILPEKLDGSLIIRSVIDGLVNFRTRGCEVLAENVSKGVEKVLAKYPLLLDPSWSSEGSMLFEYVGPSNRIIIKYNEHDLVGLARVKWDGDALEVRLCDELFRDAGIKTPVINETLSGDLQKIKSDVREFDDSEGVVGWAIGPAGTVTLMKFKSSWYMRLHHLRSKATPKYIKELCIIHKIDTLEKLSAYMYAAGHDWEVVDFIEPTFSAICKMRKENKALIDNALADFSVLYDNTWTRGELANTLKSYAQPKLFPLLMAHFTGDKVGADIRRKVIEYDIKLPALRLLLGAAMIKQAAVKDETGKVWSLPQPNRHHNILHYMHAKGIDTTRLHGPRQGFVTVGGTYVDRKEAGIIALAGKQIFSLAHPPNLFSEDLW